MAQEQWYMAIGGHQVGPVSQEDVVTNLRNGTIDGNTLVFSAGMANWTPLKDVPALAAYLKTPGAKGAAPAAAPPPISPGQRAHEIDFKILGSEMQFVEVELDPGESAVAEAGSMMYMTPGIQMETVFGDGSQQRSGVMGALLGAGKRLITGESLFMFFYILYVLPVLVSVSSAPVAARKKWAMAIDLVLASLLGVLFYIRTFSIVSLEGAVGTQAAVDVAYMADYRPARGDFQNRDRFCSLRY